MKVLDNQTRDQIRAARLAFGLTQKAAAELIGRHSKTWENLEQGKRKMHAGLFD